MPVEFLTDDQAHSYGRYAGEPTPEQLARYFYLDDADRELLTDRRGDHNRLGLALQIVTARFLGTFLSDPTDAPVAVVTNVAAQIGIPSGTDLTPYRDGEARWDHAAVIRKRYGYRDFGEQTEHFKLVRWLYTRAWLSTERTVYECSRCGERLLGERRCGDCNVYARSMGLGGSCPDCDTVILLADLLELEGRARS